MHHPEFIMFYNTENFDYLKVDEEPVKNSFSTDSRKHIGMITKVLSFHVDKSQANWIQTAVSTHEVHDDISYLQFNN